MSAAAAPTQVLTQQERDESLATTVLEDAADGSDGDDELPALDEFGRGPPSEIERRIMRVLENETLGIANDEDVQTVARLELTIMCLRRLMNKYNAALDEAKQLMRQNTAAVSALARDDVVRRRQRNQEDDPEELMAARLERENVVPPQRQGGNVTFTRSYTNIPQTQTTQDTQMGNAFRRAPEGQVE